MLRPVKWLAFASFLSIAAASSALAGTGIEHVDEVIWKRVNRFDVGTRVKVIVVGAAAVERYFVQLSDTELIVLNLTSDSVPKRQLLNMAIDNPGWIAGTSKTTYRDNNLRIGPDGVFVKDQKVADLASVVERIPREKVTSITKA
jgi:hypothetical protein